MYRDVEGSRVWGLGFRSSVLQSCSVFRSSGFGGSGGSLALGFIVGFRSVLQ